VLSEASGSAGDGVPLRGGGVDAEVHASGLQTVHHASDEVDVGLLVAGPVLRGEIVRDNCELTDEFQGC
jgi:hypothetical protein